MRVFLPLLIVALLALASTSDGLAQSAKRSTTADSRLSEPSPRLDSYATLLSRIESPAARAAVDSYLRLTTATGKREVLRPYDSGYKTQAHAKTLDLSEISPVEGLTDDWFYFGHSTVPVPGGDVLVFFWQEGLRITTRFSDGSWTSPATLIPNTFDSPIRAARTGSNRVVVAIPSESGISIAYSDDVFSVGQSAATWQTTSLAGDNFGIDMKPTPDGGLVMTYGRYDPSADVTRFWMRKSADGVTWAPESLVLSEDGNFGIFDATFVARSATEYLLVFVEAANDGLHLTRIASSDGGVTWSSPERVVANPEGLEPLPALARTSDGTIWLVYSNMGDIWYLTSSDGGVNWGAPEKWTRYAGGDAYPSISVLENVATPFVTFTSRRTFVNQRIWIASLVPGADSNPSFLPPAVSLDFTNLPFEIPHSVPLDVRIFAADETGVNSVDVFYTLGETTAGPIPASPDGAGAWVASIPGQPLGTAFTYFASATDTDGLTGVTDFPAESRTISFHNVGIITAAMPGGSISSIEWPAGSGDNYFCCGGLWIGANNAVIEDWMWETDETVTPFDGPGQSDQDIVLGIVEPDWLAPEEKLGVKVVQRSYQWAPATGKVEQATGRENGLVLEYEVTNLGDTTIPELFVGLFLDADLFASSPDWEDDIIAYEPSQGLVYMYDSGDVCAGDPEIDCPSGYIGAAVVADAVSAKTMSGVTPYTAGWDNHDGPFATLTAGIDPTLSGGVPVDPADYRMMLTAQPTSLAQLESKKIAFAVVMGGGLGELVANLQAVESVYETFVVSVDEPVDSTIPTDFSLGQNYPNPFNPSTTISYSLPTAQRVELNVYNVLGELVETLVSGDRVAGNYQITWDASNMASGMYFYRLNAGSEYTSTRSLVVLK